MLGNLYWPLLILVVGGCVGSFLNVVIYRWPRGLSTRHPRRSFCPACESAIAWYDNVPVLSYLALRGRCRHCRLVIPLQYPLVELATAAVFLMTYDALFVAGLREGVTGLATDWPLLLGHCVLFGSLIALSVMDLEAYMVDIRLTWLAAAAGVVMHAVWTPAGSWTPSGGAWLGAEADGAGGWLRPGVTQAGLAMAATLGLGLGALLTWRSTEAAGELEPGGDDSSLPVSGVVEEEVGAEGSGPQASGARWLLALPLVVLVGLYVVFVVQAGEGGARSGGWPGGQDLWSAGSPGAARLGLGGLAVFVALALAASHPRPEADCEIAEAIEAEAVDARRLALGELKLLAPAVVLGVVAVYGLVWVEDPGWQEGGNRLLHWQPVGEWRPLWGLATGLTGWVLGGAIGWLARIIFTLALGKEALGMGDVHILAAAGAVAGWPVAWLGFFLAAPLALVAVGVIALRRQSRTLPYGPWLALAFFLASLFQDSILAYLRIRWMFE